MQNIRKISDNELMYLDMQDVISTPMTIQYIIEYQSGIPQKALEKALERMFKENPCAFVVRYKNNWVASKIQPYMSEVISDSDDFINDPFFFKLMNCFEQTVALFILKNRDKNYLVAKFSHSVFDGKGALNFLEKLFSYVNEIPSEPLDNSVNDIDFLKGLKTTNRLLPFHRSYKLTQSFDELGKIKFRTITLPGYYQGMVAKLAKVLSCLFVNGQTSFMIPTDIRHYKTPKKYLSNLILPNFLEVSATDNWETINNKILQALNNRCELNKWAASYFYSLIPTGLRKRVLACLLHSQPREHTFKVGGIISYLGKIPLEKFNINENKAISFASLPVQQPLAPFSIVIAEGNQKTNIAFSYYENVINEQTFLDIKQKIEDILIQPIAYTFNETEENFPYSVTELIKNTVENSLEQIAVESNISYTYADLLKKSNAITNELRKQGVQPQDRVVLYFSRGMEYIASVLAILQLGAIFIPVDKKETEYRLKQILSELQACFLLTDICCPFDTVKTLDVSTLTNGSEGDFQPYPYQPDNILYMIFTSGTTGVPKGVMVTHRNFSNYINWAKQTYQTKERLTMPLFTSLSVDLTMTSVFLPLVSGGCIKVFPTEFNGTVLGKIYQDEKINVIKCTPSHLSLCPQNIKTVKEWLIVGGENFKTELLLKLCQNHQSIVNEYGPTEATVGCIYHIYQSKKLPVNSPTVPIGIPIANTKVFLVDTEDKLIVKEGDIGQIVISGDSLTKGYVNTSSDNFRTFQGQTCYFTGDMGFVKDDVLYCIGRIDSQVKINGVRIELDEITNALLSYPDVQSAETIVMDKRLVSFVVIKGIQNEQQILTHLKKRLLNTLIPHKIYFLESLPLLENGKIDQSLLKSYVKSTHFDNTTPIITTDPIKSFIKQKFTDIELDLNQNTLYEIGLDSLDTLVLGQELAQSFIAEEKQEAFVATYLSQTAHITTVGINQLLEKFK